MADPLTTTQAAILRRLAINSQKVGFQTAWADLSPEEREEVGGVTADQLEAHGKLIKERADAQLARQEALAQATEELVELMLANGVERQGELVRLGIADPFEQVARRFLQEHKDGDITDDELRDLGIGEDGDGHLVVSLSPLGSPRYTGEG